MDNWRQSSQRPQVHLDFFLGVFLLMDVILHLIFFVQVILQFF